jgi:hypothetical protein
LCRVSDISTIEQVNLLKEPFESLNLTHLTFAEQFNHTVDNLPSSLTHLTFGDWFNQAVDNLPGPLTHITFGVCFNHPVDKLPSSLIYLKVETKFFQSTNW